MPDEQHSTQEKAQQGNKEKKEGDVETQLEACTKKRDEYLAGWQRAKADFLNYKKEETRRFGEIAKYSTEELMRELIAVLDSFDLGITALEKEGKVEKGVYMIRTKLADVLAKWGLIPIEVKEGEQFDPEVAEAIAVVESESPSGTVVEEIEPGYRLHEKVVRPARVKVAK